MNIQQKLQNLPPRVRAGITALLGVVWTLWVYVVVPAPPEGFQRTPIAACVAGFLILGGLVGIVVPRLFDNRALAEDPNLWALLLSLMLLGAGIGLVVFRLVYGYPALPYLD